MSYNSQAEIDAAITPATRTALFTDSGTYSATAFTQALARASAVLDSFLYNAGYAVPITGTIPDLVKELEVAVFAQRTFWRKGIQLPDSIAQILNVMPSIADGSFTVPTLATRTSTGIGGVKWSGSLTGTATGQVAPVFGRRDSSGNDPLGGW